MPVFAEAIQKFFGSWTCTQGDMGVRKLHHTYPNKAWLASGAEEQLRLCIAADCLTQLEDHYCKRAALE